MKTINYWLIALVFGIVSCYDNSTLHDFYGTWVYKDNGAEMTYIIREKTLISTFNYLAVTRNSGLEILSWRKIVNENSSTKTDYPAGVEIEVKYQGEAGLEQLFIHRDKKSLINSAGELFIKQSLSDKE
jgi:hypothetical protein